MPVYPELRRLKQKDREFKASIGYIISSQPTWSLNFETLLETVKKKTVKKKKKEKKMSLLYEVKFCSDLPFGLSTHPMTLDSKHSLSNEQNYCANC